VDPVGILASIKNVGAFQAGSWGAETISDFKAFGGRILSVPGKRGLNAFSNTSLEEILSELQIKNIVLAGAVTSICVDSTGRHAAELGFHVSVLSDCTCGRTKTEQEFYCAEIFPLYAEVLTSDELINALLEVA
jgi:nicotinamidase-related amidase